MEKLQSATKKIGKLKHLKHKGLKTLKGFKSLKGDIPFYLFFIKPKWILIVFGILLTVYNYALIANRTVDYYNSKAISKFKAGQLGFLISIMIMLVLSFIVPFIPGMSPPTKIAKIIIYIIIIALWISVFTAITVLISKSFKDKNTDYDLEKKCKEQGK